MARCAAYINLRFSARRRNYRPSVSHNANSIALAVVNSHTYKARPTATFYEMVDRWTEKVLPNDAESTQRSEKSDLKAWSAALGKLPMKDVNGELLQSIVTSWKNTKSPKTIRKSCGDLPPALGLGEGVGLCTTHTI
jgi:hypothetical protein